MSHQHSPHTAVLLSRGTSHIIPEQKLAASDMSNHMPSAQQAPGSSTDPHPKSLRKEQTLAKENRRHVFTDMRAIVIRIKPTLIRLL